MIRAMKVEDLPVILEMEKEFLNYQREWEKYDGRAGKSMR